MSHSNIRIPNGIDEMRDVITAIHLVTLNVRNHIGISKTVSMLSNP